jgi:CheY-like chemotaxis protein
MKNRHNLVLVIDDDDAIREYVGFMLRKEGFIVIEATNGNEGIAAARTNPPDLIITDLVMPDKEGIETIREITKLRPACKIIAMSGSVNSNAYLTMAKHLGAHCVLRKPFERSQLEEAVHQALAAPEPTVPADIRDIRPPDTATTGKEF